MGQALKGYFVVSKSPSGQCQLGLEVKNLEQLDYCQIRNIGIEGSWTLEVDSGTVGCVLEPPYIRAYNYNHSVGGGASHLWCSRRLTVSAV